MKIFLSYARQDGAAAAGIADALREAGHEPWVDTVDLQGGDLWSAKIVDRIADCDALVVLLSETSLTSRNVAKEVQLGEQGGKLILPVRLVDVEPSGALAYALAGIHRIDLYRDWDAGTAAIVDALGGETRPTTPKTPETPEVTENVVSSGRPVLLIGAAGALVLALVIGAIVVTGGNGDDDEPEAENLAGPTSEIGQYCDEALSQLDELAGSNELTGRDLQNCDLDGADLSGADLSSTNLGGASLRGADLSGAVLARTYLVGADLTDATVTGAHLYRVEFEDAVGLDGIEWADTLVERSVCDDGPCEFEAAITINRSLIDCSASDFARGAPIAGEALGTPVLWIDDDEDCLHDDFEQNNGTLLNERDTNDSGRPDGIDGHGGDEWPLSLYSQIMYFSRE